MKPIQLGPRDEKPKRSWARAVIGMGVFSGVCFLLGVLIPRTEIGPYYVVGDFADNLKTACLAVSGSTMVATFHLARQKLHCPRCGVGYIRPWKRRNEVQHCTHCGALLEFEEDTDEPGKGGSL